MLVTGRDYCDFVLWSEKEMVLERIEPNESMESNILSKSKAFFINVIPQEMTRSLISRQISSKQEGHHGPVSLHWLILGNLFKT